MACSSAVWFALLSAALAGADPAAEVVLTGFKDSRERLSTGMYRLVGRTIKSAEGQRTDAPPPGEKQSPSAGSKQEIAVFCAFDFERRVVRFDRTQPERVVDSVAGVTRYVHTPEATIEWSNDTPDTVFITSPDQPVNRTVSPFDIRGIGIVSWRSILVNMQFPELYAILSKQKITECVRESNGLIRVSWLYGDNESGRRVALFDDKKGFTPQRTDVFSRSKDVEVLEYSTETNWGERGRTWVPTSMRMDHFSNSKVYLSVQMAFEWVTVNEPLDPKVFTEHGVDLPGSTRVVDSRLGTPIVVGPLAADSPLPARDTMSYGRWIGIAVTTLVLGVLTALWLLERRRRFA